MDVGPLPRVYQSLKNLGGLLDLPRLQVEVGQGSQCLRFPAAVTRSLQEGNQKFQFFLVTVQPLFPSQPLKAGRYYRIEIWDWVAWFGTGFEFGSGSDGSGLLGNHGKLLHFLEVLAVVLSKFPEQLIQSVVLVRKQSKRYCR